MIELLGRPHTMDEAVAWFQRVAATDEGVKPYHTDVGDLLAEQPYTDAIAARDPDRADVQLNRAAAALKLGRWAIALAAARALTGRMPGPRPALMQAFALDGMGRQADGVAILAALPPPDTAAERGEVALYLAHLQSKLGRHPAARETLIAVVDQLDGSPRLEAELRRLLAVVEDALGHTQAAAWERKRAAELIGSP